MAAELAKAPILQVRGLIAEARAYISMQEFNRGERLLGAAEHVLESHPNAELSARELAVHAEIDQAGKRILGRATDQYRLSARSFHRVLRVARSIADLEGADRIGPRMLTEALSYRAMDWSAQGRFP